MYSNIIDYSRFVKVPDNTDTKHCYTALLDLCYQRYKIATVNGIDAVVNIFRTNEILHMIESYGKCTHPKAKMILQTLESEGFVRFLSMSRDDTKWVLRIMSPYNDNELVSWEEIEHNYDMALSSKGIDYDFNTYNFVLTTKHTQSLHPGYTNYKDTICVPA